MTRRSKVKALPKPDFVRKAFEVPGLFKPRSHRLLDRAIEVFGVLTTPDGLAPVSVHVAGPDTSGKRPFSGKLHGESPDKHIFLSWRVWRPAVFQREIIVEHVMTLMNSLAKSLPKVTWLEEVLEHKSKAKRTWAYELYGEKRIVGPDLLDAVSGSYEIELYVHLHSTCLQKCLFCPAASHSFSRQQQDADLDFINELIERIVLPAAANGVYTTFRLDADDISGHHRLPEIMQAISNSTGNPVSLILPATRLSIPSGADAIADLPGLMGLTTTVFGSSAEVHDKIAGRPGAFVETLRAFKNLSNKPVWLNAHFVLSNLSCSQIAEVVDTVSHFGMDLRIQNLIADCDAHETMLRPLLPRIDEVLSGFAVAKEQILTASERIGITLSDFPICFIPEELRHLTRSDYNRQSLYQYTLSPVCEKCRHKDDCLGVPSTYIELYGTQAFAP
ncbi:MAG TPA: radical SAM protein, partial [Myxococcota bacterium]|nr:radical SAM protein [Myxococcota bacterium]